MKTYPILTLLLLTLVVTGCKKFLDINQRANITKNTPIEVDDFEELLNNVPMYELNQKFATSFSLLDVISDDAYRDKETLLAIGGPSSESFIKALAPQTNRFYLWTSTDPWDNAGSDQLYSTCYQWISQMNILIDKMPTAQPAGQEARRAVAIARGKINRAYFYLLLANAYGPAYREGSALTDLAVPLMLHASTTSQPRASVAEVYQQILTDLQDAILTPELPDLAQPNAISASKGEAWALLARAQLYKGNFIEAQKAANEALKINSQLLDYRSFLPIKFKKSSLGTFTYTMLDSRPLNLLDQRKNPEIYTARVLAHSFDFNNSFSSVLIDPALVQLFEAGDQRFLTQTLPSAFVPKYQQIVLVRDVSAGMFFQLGLTVPEMMLTKAECLARNGDTAGAIALLNALRVYRFKSGDYKELPNTVNAETALRQVLDERRRELMFRGLRLFDLKRLNLDPRFKKDLVRLDDGGKEIARLPAGSPRYLLPFSPQTLAANPFLVQNPR